VLRAVLEVSGRLRRWPAEEPTAGLLPGILEPQRTSEAATDRLIRIGG